MPSNLPGNATVHSLHSKATLLMQDSLMPAWLTARTWNWYNTFSFRSSTWTQGEKEGRLTVAHSMSIFYYNGSKYTETSHSVDVKSRRLLKKCAPVSIFWIIWIISGMTTSVKCERKHQGCFWAFGALFDTLLATTPIIPLKLKTTWGLCKVMIYAKSHMLTITYNYKI